MYKAVGHLFNLAVWVVYGLAIVFALAVAAFVINLMLPEHASWLTESTVQKMEGFISAVVFGFGVLSAKIYSRFSKRDE